LLLGELMSKQKKKIIVAISIFVGVLIPYAIAYRNFWFSQDDLGVIINGMVKDWKSFFKIFTDDIRNYITPYNYNVPQPNILSGFLRPMQNIFFSITHTLFGFNAYAFVLLNILFHALNVSLFFIIMTNLMPVGYSFLGAMLMAFYPNMTWLGWICTLQQSLALFFLFLALLFFIPLLRGLNPPVEKTQNFATSTLFYLSGFSFLLSLLSRETFVVLAPWIIFGVFLFFTREKQFWQNVKISLAKTWIFFVATIIYFLIRLNAYGIGTLERTFNSACIRFPFLCSILSGVVSKSAQVTNTIATKTSIAATSVSNVAAKTASIAAHATQQSSFFSKLAPKIQTSFFTWSNLTCSTQATSSSAKITLTFFMLFLLTFLVYSYRKNIKIFSYLLLALPFFVWPCILVYPDSRYFSSVYPLLIATVLLGIYFFIKQQPKRSIRLFVLGIFGLFFGYSLINGFHRNIINRSKIHCDPLKCSLYKFIATHNLPKNSHLIFLGTLGESDITEQFKVLANDFSSKIAHITINELCVCGKYGTSRNYRSNNTNYTVTPIPMGFRFTSLDNEHCAWYCRLYQPVRWVESDRSYTLTSTPFKSNQWYRFSLGKFFIHEITNEKHATDISIVFDKKWILPNTFFVTWDTIKDGYAVLDSNHIK